MEWNSWTGLLFQRAGAHDERGNPIIRDFFGSPLTASGNTHDDMVLAKLETVYTSSGDPGSSMMGPVEGAVFADYGTDLGSGPTVAGDPAETRNKAGSGYGYGVGVRVDSPLGPLRLEYIYIYAFNDQRNGRFHFGIGLRN